ncbi:type I restriction enzyme HsdR N-terminal domain-containing protein [Natronococcus occultus]|uniref:Type I restriction enzyme R protein N-terminal domain-containing protein n=1 Tax=Natronococcus occultus SP4 TaxID=694430 RepID=L0K107_9EURY|nr:type I restriction enzyme HsdR N-terminal domain-containing protein [Natronococcus occultus]AGB37783.1 hypothetical protein Natoc_1996 [Natronococcus occultus SP4]
MDEADLREYIERSQSLLEDSPQMGEENTKVKIIQPLIELLGWEVYSSEVDLEYPMQIGQGSARADYALQVEGAPVVFIEAKGSDSSLSDTDRSQLSSYMRQKGVDWGLLTNGKRFEVLKRRSDSDRPEEVSLGKFDLGELDENWSVVRLLSKDLVQSGEADTIAQRIEARKQAVRVLQGDKEAVSEQVAEVIVGEVGETLAQEIDAESKEFVDNLIDSLGTDREADVHLTGTATEEPVPEPENPANESEEEEYVITLYEDRNLVQTFTGESQADVMGDVVDLLIQEFGLLDEFESFPYVPGEKNAILNSEPRHPSGEEMRLYRELSDGYYLYVALNQVSKKRYVERFSGWCGLDVEFEGEWVEPN